MGIGGWFTSSVTDRSFKDGGGGGSSSWTISSGAGGGGSGKLTVYTSRISYSADVGVSTIIRVATNTAKRTAVTAIPKKMDFNDMGDDELRMMNCE